MADNTNDAASALIALAEAAQDAQRIVADAKAKMDSAKIAQNRANESQKAADALKAELDTREAALKKKEAALTELAGKVADAQAANLEVSKALSLREAEVIKSEGRVSDALAAAEKSKTNAQSYEGLAYAKLESVKAKLAEAFAI